MATRYKTKNGYYRKQISVGTVDGERIIKSFYGKTLKEANRKADKFKAELAKSPNYIQSNESFAFWADKWYESIKIHGNQQGKKIGVSQLNNYKAHIKKKKNAIGSLKLNEITLDHIQDVIDDYAKCNSKTGRPTAKKTLTDMKNTVDKVFEYAIDREVIPRNPARKAIYSSCSS